MKGRIPGTASAANSVAGSVGSVAGSVEGPATPAKSDAGERKKVRDSHSVV